MVKAIDYAIFAIRASLANASPHFSKLTYIRKFARLGPAPKKSIYTIPVNEIVTLRNLHNRMQI